MQLGFEQMVLRTLETSVWNGLAEFRGVVRASKLRHLFDCVMQAGINTGRLINDEGLTRPVLDREDVRIPVEDEVEPSGVRQEEACPPEEAP